MLNLVEFVKLVLLFQVGVGVAKPAGLLVSQDFFADLRLPYSVKRGERFPLNVTIFNYIDVSWTGTEITQINGSNISIL